MRQPLAGAYPEEVVPEPRPLGKQRLVRRGPHEEAERDAGGRPLGRWRPLLERTATIRCRRGDAAERRDDEHSEDGHPKTRRPTDERDRYFGDGRLR